LIPPTLSELEWERSLKMSRNIFCNVYLRIVTLLLALWIGSELSSHVTVGGGWPWGTPHCTWASPPSVALAFKATPSQ
jgi:hypothetical protein